MLRLSLQRGRTFAAGAVSRSHGSQWLAARSPHTAGVAKRYFADVKKPDVTLMPGSGSVEAPRDVPLPPTLNVTPTDTISKSVIPLHEMPKTPPTPREVNAALPDTSKPPTVLPPTGTGSARVAPPPGPPSSPPPIPPKPKRRLRRFFLSLLILSALGYGGGVYYARISDNWHDFFTEYVPFGEDAVSYFEEREFRRRFPDGTQPRLHKPAKGDEKVTIPSHSGISWRVADVEGGGKGSDLGSKGRHVSALEDNHKEPELAKQDPSAATAAGKTQAVQNAKKEAPTDSHTHELLPKDAAKPKEENKTAPAPIPAPAPAAAPKIEAPKSEPAKTAAPVEAASIDLFTVEGATEPAVQDVVNMMNDLIVVINGDGAASKYATAINKAKGDLSKAINDINTLKAIEKKAAEDQIRNSHIEFDNAAKELVRRLEEEIHDQETHWKDEYDAEREKLNQTFQSKLQSELDAAQKVYEQRLKNQLLDQAIALRREFTSSVRDRVESERDGRLGKLSELSSSVQELEKLTAEWNDVVDANLKTQHLIVAVEAVRASLENADRPKPFIEELAALKEVAADDALVHAAIASINPTAYQRGVPTSSQLIDRFRRVASEVRKAALLPEHAGIASHIASLALSKVMFKKGGMPVGDDVESVLSRTEMLLEEGNLDDAAREMNTLKGWAKTLSKDWLGECRRVLEVQQALDVIATEARLQSLLVD